MIKVFFGKDPGLVSKICINEIKAKNASYTRYDGFKDTITDLLNECLSLSLFDTKKTVLLTNAYYLTSSKGTKNPIKEKNQDFDGLLQYFNSPEPTCDLYIAVNGTLDPKNKFVQALKQLPADFQEVHSLKDDDYISIAFKHAKEAGGDIDREAVLLLNEYCCNDYSLFINNLNKLLLYNKHVRSDDVKLLVSKPLEDKAYDLASKLLTKNIKSALRSFQELRKNGWDSLSLLSTIAQQFRFFALTKYLVTKGLSNDQIASELSTKTTRVKGAKIYYTRKDSQNFSYSSLIDILCQLGEMEKDIKLKNDSADERIELFILSFA